jgi:hypothetical protein
MELLMSWSRRNLALLFVVVMSTAGCRSTGKPQFFGPQGSAGYQQMQAQRFDPYPDTNVGPEVEGGRPDGFTAPPPESTRGRPNQWTQPLFNR